MKNILLVLLISAMCNVMHAKRVSRTKAESYALTFMNDRSGQMLSPIGGLKSQTNTHYHIFNTKPEGWIIISGDDGYKPVIAYSLEGSFNLEQAPEVIKDYLKEVNSSIEASAKQGDIQIHQQWKKQSLKSANAEPVKPLLKTSWGQACIAGNFNGKAIPMSGCVATAMSQLINYYAYPAQGKGIHSYNHAFYGKLSVDFSKQKYDYAKISGGTSSCNDDKAKFIYDCGVALSTNFHTSSSAASNSSIPFALSTYFKYATSAVYMKKKKTPNFLQLVKDEIAQGHPIILGGYDKARGGHAFIADGYDDDLLHLNLGWDGMSNGYYDLSSLNGFSKRVDAIINVRKPKSPVTTFPFVDNFEDDLSQWESGGEKVFITDKYNQSPESGKKSCNLFNGAIAREITIPENAKDFWLVFSLKADATLTKLPVGSTLHAYIENYEGNETLEVLANETIFPGSKIDWKQFKVCLDKYKGQTLRFVIKHDNRMGGDTPFYIDGFKAENNNTDIICINKAYLMKDNKSILLEWNVPVDISNAEVTSFYVSYNGYIYFFKDWAYYENSHKLILCRINPEHTIDLSKKIEVTYILPAPGKGIVGERNQKSVEAIEWFEVSKDVFSDVNDELSTGLVIMPNPAQNYIKCSKNVDRLDVYSISGKKLLSFKGVQANASLDVSTLSKGMYMVHLIKGRGKCTLKLLKR